VGPVIRIAAMTAIFAALLASAIVLWIRNRRIPRLTLGWTVTLVLLLSNPLERLLRDGPARVLINAGQHARRPLAVLLDEDHVISSWSAAEQLRRHGALA